MHQSTNRTKIEPNKYIHPAIVSSDNPKKAPKKAISLILGSHEIFSVRYSIRVLDCRVSMSPISVLISWRNCNNSVIHKWSPSARSEYLERATSTKQFGT